MTKLSHRNRPLCEDDDCTVEIEVGRKYCDGHAYLIDQWLKDSRAVLAKAKGK